MEGIRKSIQVSINNKETFHRFVHEFNAWWPSGYTWSQQGLQEISIDAKKDGLCTEIGPYGFRCDWGRVIDLEENGFIALKWQISPKRVPIPNPDEASSVSIEFSEQAGVTSIALEHFDFGKHGPDGNSYKQAMNGEMGWDYILMKFKKYCES